MSVLNLGESGVFAPLKSSEPVVPGVFPWGRNEKVMKQRENCPSNDDHFCIMISFMMGSAGRVVVPKDDGL